MSDSESFELEPSLKNILDQTTLQWIFVGGKGGVGKTTTSCSLAVQMAKVRKNVLLISTDPAHNLSDAFGQKFSKTPTPVQGIENLYCMEIDPAGSIQEMLENSENGAMTSIMKDLAFAIPGVDEAMGFAEVMKSYAKVFVVPIDFGKGLGKGFAAFWTIWTHGTTGIGAGLELSKNKRKKIKKIGIRNDGVINEVNKQFQDPDKTTFICVCISEFLSLYETERLIQELTDDNIDTHNIVVNQLLFPPKDSNCEQCLVRRKMQQKYLDQINDLYEDFHITKLPLLTSEVRGVENLKKFSELLMNPITN
ncbi:ATPase GET3 [Zancudomyces culisetae]|uniref:ATPase GET3 n=1 Tax=Zancudomyces culisetae TaxID=1213189 RepID=A0A1R1PKJ8_ZANCU|nr:ATPase GET3 [Zancudomyces culisetae]OMH81469.1 ATPase GET3 [Zancudomyces culisetae]|eukprot:OMH78894.1 ATPase GET3 [Zancudomyces culisetae]